MSFKNNRFKIFQRLTEKDIKKILDFIDFLNMSKNDYHKFTEIFQFMETKGYHVTKSEFYSPIPIVSNLEDKDFIEKDLPGINWNESFQLELLEKLSKFSSEFQDLIDQKKFDMNNGAFATHDAPVYFQMIRHFLPKKIIEIGAGNSTILSSIAAELNKNTKLKAIDPYVEEKLKEKIPKSVEFIEKPIQQVTIDELTDLDENDILFIDSSHVSKIGSDVNYLYLEILPRLKKGVLVHIHDIFLPKEYPKSWIKNDHRRFWNEQYLLNAFLIGNNLFEIIFSNSFLGYNHQEKLRKLYKTNTQSGGGSFWMRKLKDF